jgi:hypothetical protein
MTRDQAQHALTEIATRGNGSAPVAIYLNGRAVLHGRVAYDESTGLLVVDDGRAYIRCEQCAAIEIEAA